MNIVAIDIWERLTEKRILSMSSYSFDPRIGFHRKLPFSCIKVLYAHNWIMVFQSTVSSRINLISLQFLNIIIQSSIRRKVLGAFEPALLSVSMSKQQNLSPIPLSKPDGQLSLLPQPSSLVFQSSPRHSLLTSFFTPSSYPISGNLSPGILNHCSLFWNNVEHGSSISFSYACDLLRVTCFENFLSSHATYVFLRIWILNVFSCLLDRFSITFRWFNNYVGTIHALALLNSASLL